MIIMLKNRKSRAKGRRRASSAACPLLWKLGDKTRFTALVADVEVKNNALLLIA